MLPAFKLHPRCLAKSVDESGWEHQIRILTEDNEVPGHHLGVYVTSNPKWLDGATPEEVLAIQMLDYYTHEMGEHLLIEGFELNQHTTAGKKNLHRVLMLFAEYARKRYAHFNGDLR